MPGHIPLFIAGALLIAGPETGKTPPTADGATTLQAPSMTPQGQELSDAEALSAVAGKIVGAASMCAEIGRERVSAAATKTAQLVSAAASDESEIESARQLFAENAAVGKEAVRNGNADCRAVEASLTTLERVNPETE